ncbi:MAG: hypothetical protein KDA20_08415, partial [Phycisphaerales bacterium]|nr:hypothetical protein [Phycisphaerales bacterium]
MTESKSCCAEQGGSCKQGGCHAATRSWRLSAGVCATIIASILMAAAAAKLHGPSLSKLITIGGKDYLV